jgi:hypothetical protein
LGDPLFHQRITVSAVGPGLHEDKLTATARFFLHSQATASRGTLRTSDDILLTSCSFESGPGQLQLLSRHCLTSEQAGILHLRISRQSERPSPARQGYCSWLVSQTLMHVTDSACYTNTKTLWASHHRPQYTSLLFQHKSCSRYSSTCTSCHTFLGQIHYVCIPSPHIAPEVRSSVTPPGR